VGGVFRPTSFSVRLDFALHTTEIILALPCLSNTSSKKRSRPRLQKLSILPLDSWISAQRSRHCKSSSVLGLSRTPLAHPRPSVYSNQARGGVSTRKAIKCLISAPPNGTDQKKRPRNAVVSSKSRPRVPLGLILISLKQSIPTLSIFSSCRPHRGPAAAMPLPQPLLRHPAWRPNRRLCSHFSPRRSPQARPSPPFNGGCSHGDALRAHRLKAIGQLQMQFQIHLPDLFAGHWPLHRRLLHEVGTSVATHFSFCHPVCRAPRNWPLTKFAPATT